MFTYNVDKLKSTSTNWADFWDIKKLSGKRDPRKGVKYTPEFALMADGVAPRGVYGVLVTKEGQDRTLKKPDEVKSSTQQQEVGIQPPQYLVSDDMAMSSAYNGWIAAVQKESNLKVVWSDGIYNFDAWAIPEGTKKQEKTLKFVALLVQPQQ